MRYHPRAIVFLMLLFVGLQSGCALVPGSYLKDEKPDDQNYSVNFHVISPELLAALPKASSSASQMPSEANINGYDYCVGRGDILSITVWDHPELTIPAGSQRSAQDAGHWVHSNGEIFYPYIGSLKVDGLNVSQVRELISTRLAKYIESPQVDVTVAAFRSQRVYVTGEVVKPGMLPVTNVPLTLIEAINATGGLTDRADWDTIVVQRNGQEFQHSLRSIYQMGDASQNIILHHNDLVHVEQNDRSKVFVLGEVRQPKSYAVGRHGLTLAEALAEAGGLFEATADASGIFVVRQARPEGDAIADVYQLNAKNATALILAEQFQLKPRDIIYVTAAPVARWNRVIGQLLPTVTGLYSLGRFRTDLMD